MDVTTIIGAEDFVLTQNRGYQPADPFSRQCFVELIQSLIFMSEVLVSHPTLTLPRAEDFGERPLLLRSLMAAGLLKPLTLSDATLHAASALESAIIGDLRSRTGTASVLSFIGQTVQVDALQGAGLNSLAGRIRAWAEFQAVSVRVHGHHRDRIATTDGIEDGPFGEWARAAGDFLAGTLEPVMPRSEAKYLMATLARGLKYQVWAEAAGTRYQSHPLRRDFLVTFDLRRVGEREDRVFEIIKAIRGIYASVADAVGDGDGHRVQLLELELPLLGGRLWRPGETGRLDEQAWVDLVVHRIAEYRESCRQLRFAIENCVLDEDYLRLARDIDGVRLDLLERLGLRNVALSAVERDFIEGVASVAEAIPGVPSVSGLWLSVRRAKKQMQPGGSPVQRFLYREFFRAWKRTAR